MNLSSTATSCQILQADAVSHSLGVAVLRHRSLKPSYSCIRDIQAYFASLDPPVHMEELAIVGDRIFTDVILANRMRWRCLRQTRPALLQNVENEGRVNELDSYKAKEPRESGIRLPLAIHTTGLWKKESLMMRWVENGMARMVERWTLTEDRMRAKQEMAAKFIRTDMS